MTLFGTRSFFVSLLFVWIFSWLYAISFNKQQQQRNLIGKLLFYFKTTFFQQIKIQDNDESKRILEHNFIDQTTKIETTTTTKTMRLRIVENDQLLFSSSSSKQQKQKQLDVESDDVAKLRQYVDFYPGKSRLPKPRRLSCAEILLDVQYVSSEPFARGFVKSVWLANFSGESLIIKRPASHDIVSSNAKSEFRYVSLLRILSIISKRLHCSMKC